MEQLGEVSVPSGILSLCDPGHIGMFLAEEIPAVPAVHLDGLPRDRALRVMGQRLTSGESKGCWDFVAIEVSDAPIATRDEVDELMVDFARIMVSDEKNNDDWVHDDPIDGQADFVFWGRDAASLAKEVGAPALDEGFGWENLPIDEVVELGTAAEAAKEARGWKLATDFRPHSHHWQVMAQVRTSKTDSGTIDVAGRRVCVFMTSWGDGVFPVFCDRDAAGGLVRVRIQLFAVNG